MLQTGLILAVALMLALVGGWGLYQLLGRLRLSPSERLALTLALLPAVLGLAAFGGLLAGHPGPLLPATVCAMLGVAGVVVRRRPHPPTPSPAQRGGGLAATGRPPHPTMRPLLPHGPPTPSPAQRGGGLATTAQPPGRKSGQDGKDDLLTDLPPLRAGEGGWGGEVSPRAGKGEASPRAGKGEASPGAGGGEVASVALAAGLYAAGALGTTLLTPLSGGALRIGDWVAHWFLVLVYTGQPLPDLRVFTNRVGDFGVISRPPLYNLEGGLLVGALASSGEASFWPFQLMTPLLALPLVAAGVLWAHELGGPRAARVLAALAGLSPFLIQNASYPWSKMVAAALVLLFLYLIRAAALARQPDRARQTFVLAAFCAGLAYLAHPTSVFYILPTLLWLVWRRPRPLFRSSAGWSVATWALGGVAGLAAFAPWQGWVLATYGLQATLDANPASFGADVSDTLADWLLKGGVAAVGTVLPLPALTTLVRGSLPTLDQLLRVQLALLTGAFGVSGCWLLARSARRKSALTPPAPLSLPRERGEQIRIVSPSPAHRERGRGGEGLLQRWLRRPPWLPLVVVCGFLGQVMLQPNWHDTGDAAESMTPIVILGLAIIAREALRLGPGARRLFFGLVLAEFAVYLGLWLVWAFGSAWTRDPNAVLASRYALAHLRGVWGPAVPLGALLLAGGLLASTVLLWRTLAARSEQPAQDVSGSPV